MAADTKSFAPSDFGLQPNTNQYRYENEEQYSSIFGEEFHRFIREQRHSQYFILSNLDLETYLKIFDEISCDSYFPTLKVALVKMKSAPNSATAGQFQALLQVKLLSMNGNVQKLSFLGGTTVETPTRKKEPDASFCPSPLPKCRSLNWPSVIVEVGFSIESARKLEEDAKWWLVESNGDVLNVLTIDICRGRNTVTFKLWALNNTRQIPEPIYCIVISTEYGIENARATNENPLIILYENFFLKPITETWEKDLTFTVDDLKRIAIQAWELESEYESEFKND